MPPQPKTGKFSFNLLVIDTLLTIFILDVANITENEQKVVELITVEVWDQINNVSKSDPKEKLSVEVSQNR